MKKLILLLICCFTVFSLCACRTEYVEAEDIRAYNETNLVAYFTSIPCDMAERIYFDYYPTDDTVIYFPVSGEYTTSSGEKFTAVVGENCHVRFLQDVEHSRICYDVAVYGENGELIVEKKGFCSYVQKGSEKMDLTYVSEEFKPYWTAIAVSSAEMK